MDYFKALAAKLEQSDPIDDFRIELTEAVDELISSLPDNDDMVEGVGLMREIPPELLKEKKCFFIPPEYEAKLLPSLLQQDRAGLCLFKSYITQRGRFVIPIQDVKGNIMGFNGWNYELTPKYKLTNSYGFKAKSGTFIGMEQIANRKSEYMFLTEGIFDAFYLQSLDIDCMVAMGSILTYSQMMSLKAIESKLIVIPDNDHAGINFGKQVKKMLPNAKVFIPNAKGDLDELRKSEVGERVDKDLKILARSGNVLTNLLRRV